MRKVTQVPESYPEVLPLARAAREGILFVYSFNQRWVSGLMLGSSDTVSKADSHPCPRGVRSAAKVGGDWEGRGATR